ncbi:IscS subfamily cysteine desulfurase [Blastopirellula marina]|uniref:cysteine desulfurase n=1 Tax=Blastopirellula marina TaxID=124 RepID=A0A2S8F012_9BACT|nr:MULTISPECIES: aminotransferase class V-fold PLP-dependent enzyme [Pirellulaceae]PQO25508.1 IscS subfamily cysteine desulfurase [Blastopirellula marina]RCS42472.1 aminotransferase class V-fold PLP-dependent enzyme [Bremerella cremea]
MNRSTILATAVPIYFDNHATTQVDPRVVEAMLPTFTQVFGNPSSVGHLYGEEAKQLVEASQQSIALAIGASASEIVFTSGATESNNLAISGVLSQRRRRGNHVVTVTTEHKAVLDPLEQWEHHGFEITRLSPRQASDPLAGMLDPDQVRDAIRPDTTLVSVMLANNEIGVIHPIAEIGQICKEQGVLLHSDATQAVGKTPVDVERLGVDLMSFSAHKMYGPKGVGGLYVRKSAPRVRLQPAIFGGGQQRGIRSGTLNVPGIVGLAEAIRLSVAEMEEESQRLAQLRKQLWSGLTERIAGLHLNGPSLEATGARLAGNLNFAVEQVDGEALMMNVREIAVSSGSACTSANPQPSHVLRAIGLSEDLTRSSLRFGIGRFNTPQEVEFAVDVVAGAVDKLRKLIA